VWVIPTHWALAISRLLELLLAPFGKEPTFNTWRVRFSAMTKYYSITKAKQRLGYQPLVSLEEGIKRGVKKVMTRYGWDKKGAVEKKTQ